MGTAACTASPSHFIDRPRGGTSPDRSLTKMSSQGRGLTKWQVAALSVGAVAVVAGGALVAYAWVKGRSRRKPEDDEPEATPQPGAEGSRSEAATTKKPESEPKVSAAVVCRSFVDAFLIQDLCSDSYSTG